MTPPPGWYPDPHAPHLQRWWDGTAWTEHRHAPEAPAAPSPGGGTGRARTVALTATGVVLVAAIVTGAVALGGGSGGGTETRTAPTTTPAQTPGAPEPAPEASTSEPSADDPAVVEDQLNGVTFPLLDGWERPQHVAQDDVVMTTDGTYDCPGGVGLCRHGMVFSRTVTENDETSPEALAKADISEAADEAYDRDSLGRELHGGMTSHQVVKSGPVAVAGRAGYLVRWRVKTAKGPGGYVQSLVFPSSVGTEAPVLVRYVFDAGEDGPPLADMDRLTKGIRPFGDADTGGGVGSSIGPTD
ncbi:DUF2510 domain-containing protein [Streptomyces sp. NEAU-H22]|uniref:DUF2510 domain-containing protein n=1 Tax=unclassified Streptomyces TaxID=2593676 RepID=UPI002257E69E|nr:MULTISPECIES: DUF2510 domain-containing protein [unclassified Streptomyces]MCX3289404.1 DUF2510 domain-containing protein [Streptomyces sp. NEAU-H22]WMD10164.1 DUF2510 domain-containing protein [Streptomyces sp. FXY-T5]